MASDNSITINLELSEQARESLNEYVTRIEQALAVIEDMQKPVLIRSSWTFDAT